jgi:hypothetical protein
MFKSIATAASKIDLLPPRRFLYSTFQISAKFAAFHHAASSFIEGNCGSPYHGRVFLNSARQMAPTKNLSRG